MTRPLRTRSMRVRVTKCRVTGKRRYSSEVDAKIAKAGTADNVKREKVEQRAFLCKHCRGFHLTSQSVEEYNRRKATFEKEN